MVELRKRKTPSQLPSAKKRSKVAREPAADLTQKMGGKESQERTCSSTRTPNVGDTIVLDGFGGEIETNDGGKTSLKKLVDDSDSGVVLFTYPKASTPGCKFNAQLRPLLTSRYLCTKCVHLRTFANYLKSAVFLALLKLMCSRYQTGLPVSGSPWPVDIHWSVYLWTLSRFAQSELHIQNQAKSTIPASLRHRYHIDCRNWIQEEP